MRRFLLLSAALLTLGIGYSQNFNISTTTVNVDCIGGGTLFDSGGATGDYANNENFVFTVCPGTPGFGVFASMIVMDIEVGDQLTIYNGNSTAAPVYPDMPLDNSTNYGLGAQFQSTVTNPTGCLTFEFISNGDGLLGSFEFELDCEARCQEVISEITFSDPDTSLENGDIYINICPGDTLDISASALYPDNNTEYAQSNATSTFTWNWGDNSPVELGQTASHFYPTPGGYIMNLNVVDVNGCRNFQDQVIKIRVAPEPEFVGLSDTLLCLGQLDTLTGLPQGTIINGNVVQGTSQFFQPPIFSGDSLPLPDGNGAGYDSDAFITSFGNGDLITNCGDILELCINMEHSYIGDLEITLICPNGQSTIIKSFPGGGGTFLGQPNDPAFGGADPVGSGLQYCFNPIGTTTLVNGPTQAWNNPATATNGNTIVPGNYLPEQPFTNLIGCPINGQWTLNITDNLTVDNGFLFNWELNIDPCLFPEIDSFTMLYDFGLWNAAPTINSVVGGNPNTIEIEPDSVGFFEYTYRTFDQFGCEYTRGYLVYCDGFDVEATPDTSTICAGEATQLNATVTGTVPACIPDYFAYNVPYNKEITTGPTTPIVFTQADNGVSPSIPLPFPFQFYCQNQTQVRVSSNGYISFANSGLSIPNNTTIPTPAAPSNMVALYWDDLIDSSNVSNYFTTGVAPNRKFVIELDLIHVGGTSATESVLGQIILHETTNMIDVLCENCQQDASDPTATQGIENNIGLAGAVPTGRNNTAWTAMQDAWRFYPQSSLNTDYTITWSPTTGLTGDSTQAPLANPAVNTEYIVEIANANNCAYSDTVSVLVGGNYSTNITNDTVICLGDSIQLLVTGGAQTIAWTPSSGNISDSTVFNPTVMPDTTTTYIAEVDSAGCTALLPVTVSVSNIEVDSTVVQTETCAGDGDASIEIFASGGVNPQYSIDGGATFVTTNLFQPLASGTYNIVVNENGLCDTSYQVTIIGGAPLVFDSILISNPNCGATNDGIVEVYLSTGIQPYQYSVEIAGVNLQDSLTFNGLGAGQYVVFVVDSFNCSIDSTIVLTQPDTLLLSTIQIDSVSCFNSSDGEIQVAATGGTAPYLFSIDGTAYGPTNTFSNLNSGTYSLYVQDANACLDSISVEVEAPDSIVLIIDSTNVTCNGLANGTAIVFASGGTPAYTYLWDDPLAHSTIGVTNLDVGIYQVIVSDQNSCADTATVNIEEPDSLLLSIDNVQNILCNGDATGSVAVSTTGGTAPYAYFWSNGGGVNEDLNNASAGTYTLTVTDANACANQITQIVTEPTALSINLTGTNIDCFGDQNGSVDATVGGGVGDYAFTWTGPNGFISNTEDITGLDPGLYTLTLTDSNNCTLTDNITIIEPTELQVSFNEDAVSCFGGNDGSLTVSVQSGGTGPFTFLWDAAANNQLSPTATGLIAGTYQVTVTDANNCVVTFNESVTEPATPLSIILTGTDITCAGANDGIAEVVANGGTPTYTYLWNDPLAQTSAQATGLAQNIYQVTVTDANGCSESDTVFIEEPLAIAVFPVADSANCWGEASGSISLSASGGTGIGYAYSIDGGQTFQNSTDFFNLPAGIYDEIIVLDLGSNTTCLSQLFTTTVFEQPYFSFEVMPSDTILQLEESVDLILNVTSPNYTNASITQVIWFPTSGLNCSDCIDPTVLTYDSYTEYTATVSYFGDDNVLCNASSNTVIQVENNLELYIPNAFTPGSFDDMNDVFEVYGEGIEYVTMQVYNRWGEKVFESSNQKVAWDGTFKGEMQSPGVYTYYVNVEYLNGKIIERKGSVTLIR